MILKPVGVHSRPLPDFFAHGGMCGRGFTQAVAAKMGEVVLYNNASDGSYLRLYGFVGRTNVAGPILMEPVSGSFGSLVSAGAGGAQQIQLDQALGPGQLFIGASASCIGYALLGVYTFLANTDYHLFSEFPLVIIPPGYSITMESSNVNAFVDITYYWMPTRRA